MPLVDVLDIVLVLPLMAIYEYMLEVLLVLTQDVGWALVGFSVVVNITLLPVYYRMRRASEKGRLVKKEVDAEVRRISEHFKGRERYFYSRAVHRQFGYRPLSAVLNSSDLLLQVLIFATVYQFLSHWPALEGASFGPIPSLSRPDRLLSGVNVLPLLMTLANGVSAMVYVEDRAERRPALGLALLFLVLLYDMPSGLVVYWTTNNLFSLIRNLLERRLVPSLPAEMRTGFSRLADQD